jgi:hypothetical protein
MALRRLISASLGSSRKFKRLNTLAGELAEFCHSLFPLLVVCSDDHGRLSGDAASVKMEVCPFSSRSEFDVEEALDLLSKADLITRYVQADGEPVIQVVKFKDHQPQLKQRKSSFAEPPQIAAGCRNSPQVAAVRREKPPDSNLIESIRYEERTPALSAPESSQLVENLCDEESDLVSATLPSRQGAVLAGPGRRGLEGRDQGQSDSPRVPLAAVGAGLPSDERGGSDAAEVRQAETAAEPLAATGTAGARRTSSLRRVGADPPADVLERIRALGRSLSSEPAAEDTS